MLFQLHIVAMYLLEDMPGLWQLQSSATEVSNRRLVLPTFLSHAGETGRREMIFDLEIHVLGAGGRACYRFNLLHSSLEITS
jgi:hypothetical protein